MSEWNTEEKLGQYSPQLRQKLLSFKSLPHPHFPIRNLPNRPERPQKPVFSSPPPGCTVMWNPGVLSEPGLDERGTVSSARLCQWRCTKTPTRPYFPPQRWAPKSKLTAIHAQNTWAKTVVGGGADYLGVAGKSALVRQIFGSRCTNTTHQHFSSHSAHRFSPSVFLCCYTGSRGFSCTELACAAVLFVYISQGPRVLLLAPPCCLAWMQPLSRPELAPNDKSCSWLMQQWGRYK